MKIIIKYWDRLLRTLQNSHLWKILLHKHLSGKILAYLLIEKTKGLVNGYHLFWSELHSHYLLLFVLFGPTWMTSH